MPAESLLLPSAPAPSRHRRISLLILAVATLAFVRLRGAWAPWVSIHAWLAERGVPSEIRNLDAWLILLVVPLGAALVLARGRLRPALGGLGLLAPPARAVIVALVTTLPMYVAGALSGKRLLLTADVLYGAALAPLVEEVFFRGMLCALVVREAGMRFWPAAALGASLFGLSHVSWTAVPTVGSAAVFMVTAAGGIWYAWLLRRWRWNLWVPIFLHGSMNFSWLLFGVTGGAVGGLVPNLGRVVTIAIATAVTLRPTLLGFPRRWTQGGPIVEPPDPHADPGPARTD